MFQLCPAILRVSYLHYLMKTIDYNYSNPSANEQSVYEFSVIWEAQINTCFSIYEPIFAKMSSFLSQTDRCSRREVMGN
jgi:hypothetical protein